MGGRAGSGTNWDLMIAVLAAIGTVVSFGFLVSLIKNNETRKFKYIAFVDTANQHIPPTKLYGL